MARRKLPALLPPQERCTIDLLATVIPREDNAMLETPAPLVQSGDHC